MGRDLFLALQLKKEAGDVQRLVTSESVKEKDPFYSKIPLFWALQHNAGTEVVKLLLDAWPDSVKEKGPAGWVALHYVEGCSPAVAKMIIQKYPDAAKIKDEMGMLPLHWAVEHNVHSDVVKEIFDAYPGAVRERDEQGRLPIKIACDNDGSADVISLLDNAYPRGRDVMCGEISEEALDKFVVTTRLVLPVALLFPGQGSQNVGMLRTLKDLPEVADLLAKAKNILGYDITQVCLQGPEAKLEETTYCQPAVYVASLAALEVLKKDKPVTVDKCRAAAGLSLGEYTALTAAGVWSFEDGLKLVKLRAEAMDAACKERPQAMLSVAGLSRRKLESLCEEARQKFGNDSVCQIANELFPKGFALAGTKDCIEMLEKTAKNGGAMQARILKTSGGFHTKLMLSAQAKLVAALEEVQMERPRCDVYMNTTGVKFPANAYPKPLKELLAKQMTSPVLWEACVQNMIDDGCTEFYEIGPGKQLKAMMKRVDAKIFETTYNVGC